MVAVTAARENNRRMEEALAAFTEADKRAQRALTALPPCPVTTTNESTHELIARARDRLEALAEHRDVIATGGATLDRCLEAMVPQAAAIAALTTQLENSVAETTAVEAAIAQLESAQKGVFTAQEEEHIEEATAAKLQPQLADSERLNRQEIADLEAQIKEVGQIDRECAISCYYGRPEYHPASACFYRPPKDRVRLSWLQCSSCTTTS